MTVVRWLGIVVLALIGVPQVVVGLLGVGEPPGRGILCLGVLLTGTAVGGAAGLVAERRTPPPARLESRDGEPALFLPRSPGPSRIASWSLGGYAATALLGAVVTAVAGSWGWAVVLLVLAAGLAWTAAPGRDLAGGLWLTPTRLVHDHLGARWEVRWDDVTGVVPQPLMPVLVRPDRVPTVERRGPRGRAWNQVRGDGVIAVDTRHLSGGDRIAPYVISRAITDPASRRVLGTRDSLPPGTPVST